MAVLRTRRQVLLVGGSVSLAAGVLVVLGSFASAMTRSGWPALASFGLAMAIVVVTSVALLPAWRRTIGRS